METGPADFPGLIAALLPGARVEVDPPPGDGGEWWFDIGLDGRETQVSWAPGRGFGLYLGTAGYGERPSEIYTDAGLLARRLQQMAGETPAPMEIGRLRKLLGQTQAEVAATLRIGQANVSRLESRRNPTLGSMRALVEAMGGELEVRVRFKDLDAPIALPAPETGG